MGKFTGIEDQKVNTNRFDINDTYFKPGNYIVEVSRVFIKEKMVGGEVLLAECKILESDNPAIKVGQIRTWGQSLQFKNMKHKSVSLKTIAEFFTAALGEFPEGGFTESAIEELTSEANPLAGYKLKIKAYAKEVGDKIFTNYSFYPVK